MFLLSSLFSRVCGQNPDHTWVLGGLPLPCCQRCTGLYAGALLAIVLHAWLRPRLSRGFVQVHALFLLQLALAGLPGLAQGPVLRTFSGLFYGFGVVAFLWSPITLRLRPRPSGAGRMWRYAARLGASLVLVLSAVAWDQRLSAMALSGIVLAGAMALAALILVDIALVGLLVVSGGQPGGCVS
jgi:uncharacterized membrane protein